MIAIDGSPLGFGPHSVARMLRGWLQGWPRGEDAAAPLLLLPEGAATGEALPEHVRLQRAAATSPRRFRARLPALVADASADALLVPWMAVPDLRDQGVPVVATVHELPFVRHGPIEGRRRRASQRTWLRRDAERCAALLTPSEATRADVLALDPSLADRTHVVPHGFDPSPWVAARREPKEPPYALMLGVGQDKAHARKKGLDVLLAAWADASPPGWRLVLVGQPALRVPEGVEVRAEVEDAALPSLVAGASLLVYPSRMEGFGFPPLEAMAADVPVLSTDAGSLPEVVGTAAYVVAANDVAALAEGLRILAADKARRDELRTRGRERADAFPVHRAAQSIVEIFGALGVRA